MNKTTTRTATIFMDENNVLQMVMLEGVRLDYEDALDNGLVIKNLTAGKPTLKLIDGRLNFSMDKKAREFIRSMDTKQTIARAVVKSSRFGAIIINFFTRISKPAVPTRIFTNYEEAYNWLMGFKEGK